MKAVYGGLEDPEPLLPIRDQVYSQILKSEVNLPDQRDTEVSINIDKGIIEF